VKILRRIIPENCTSLNALKYITSRNLWNLSNWIYRVKVIANNPRYSDCGGVITFKTETFVLRNYIPSKIS
jgi:hypothetical protein